MGGEKAYPFRPWLLRYWVGRYIEHVCSRGKVAGGVFSGMAYVRQSVGSQLIPKWLGTYECELIPLFISLLAHKFEYIIDVGAAEGYYAVGAAIKWPAASVTAFESTEDGRTSIEELARLNGVGNRIKISGHCDVAGLAMAIPQTGAGLIIMDVEGAEYELLEPSSIHAFDRCHIVVELHEWVHGNLDAALRKRFAPTHAISETWTRKRTMRDFASPEVAMPPRLLHRGLIAAVDEWRPGPMRWLYMQPRENIIAGGQ